MLQNIKTAINTVIARLWGDEKTAEKVNYLIFGGLTTVVNFVVFFAANELLGVDYRPATVLAWCAAVAFAFVVNKRYVFRSRTEGLAALVREIMLFLTARVSSLLFDMGWMILAVEILHMNELWAKILSNVVVVVVNYFFSKLFVFRKPDNKNDSKHAKNSDKNENISSNGKMGGMPGAPVLARARLLRERQLLAVSFFLPVVLLLVILLAHKVYPFGKNVLMIVDNYHQYTPFLMEFGALLRRGGSLFYNWNAGLGSNFLGRYAYYLASPLNVLAVLMPKKWTVEFILGLILLRTGFAGLSFAYYLREKYKTMQISTLIFPALYALSAFFLAYYWNIMWFDGVALFPLVVLGLERLTDGKKGTTYCAALALTVFSNFFIAILVCIASVLYFLVYSLGRTTEPDRTKKRWWTWFFATGLRFAGYSLLAGGLAAVLALPTYYSLLLSSSAEAVMPVDWSTFTSLLEVLANHMVLVKPTVMTGTPNIYCGVIVLLLVPLYFGNRRIPLREKVPQGILAVFLLLSFNLNVLNFLWHGGHYPNSLPHRFSFIYVFFILQLAYRALMQLRGVEVKHIIGGVVAVLVLLLVWEHSGGGEKGAPWTAVYATMGFLVLYGMLLTMLRTREKPQKQAIVALILVCAIAVEIALNGAYGFGEAGLYLHDNYVTNMDSVTPAVEKLKAQEQGFERMEFVAHDTYNTPVVYDYKGISHYSSTSMIKVNNLFGRLGLVYSTAWYVYESNTPLFNSLFSLKYLLSKGAPFDNGLYSEIDHVGDVYSYENPWVLPIGFMVKDSIYGWDAYGSDPFQQQQDFLEAALGTETAENLQVFRPLTIAEGVHSGVNVTARGDGQFDLRSGEAGRARFYAYADNDGPLYWYVDGSRAESAQITGLLGAKSHPTKYPYIIDAGGHGPGELSSAEISIEKGGDTRLALYAYGWNQEAFLQAFNLLVDEGLQVTSYTDTSLTGTITVKEEGVLFTTIPYEAGWRVTVDGVPTEAYGVADGALLTVSLSPGMHEIAFRYHIRGFWPGLGITAVCLLLFVLLHRAGKRGKNPQKPDNRAVKPGKTEQADAKMDEEVDEDVREPFDEDFGTSYAIYDEIYVRGVPVEEMPTEMLMEMSDAEEFDWQLPAEDEIDEEQTQE